MQPGLGLVDVVTGFGKRSLFLKPIPAPAKPDIGDAASFGGLPIADGHLDRCDGYRVVDPEVEDLVLEDKDP